MTRGVQIPPFLRSPWPRCEWTEHVHNFFFFPLINPRITCVPNRRYWSERITDQRWSVAPLLFTTLPQCVQNIYKKLQNTRKTNNHQCKYVSLGVRVRMEERGKTAKCQSLLWNLVKGNYKRVSCSSGERATIYILEGRWLDSSLPNTTCWSFLEQDTT